ncbi:MAG: alpha/beta hydrolase [Bacillota bacterium]|nr:alpha/beta hydrolase [Bacillota bacterium]
MNVLQRLLIRGISALLPDVRTQYPRIRRLQEPRLPLLQPVWQGFDLLLRGDGRPVPLRIFEPGQNSPLPDPSVTAAKLVLDADRGPEIPPPLLEHVHEAAPPTGLILFFHGGGWVTGTIDSYSAFCAAAARWTGWPVISVDYRLAPEHPFPAALNDCRTVAGFLYRAAPQLGILPENIVLMGDSAGGNLAAALALYARTMGHPVPRRQILLYPALSGDYGPDSRFASMHEHGEHWLLTRERIGAYMDLYLSRPEDRENPLSAPLLARSLHDQPETLVITAEYDPLRDEGEAYAARLVADGNAAMAIRVLHTLHGYMGAPGQGSATAATWCLILPWLGLERPAELLAAGGEHPVEWRVGRPGADG